MPNEYIDYQDTNFWQLFNFIVERLHIDLKEAYEQLDAINNLSQIPLEYRIKELCLLALATNPSTTLKYIPDEIKTKKSVKYLLLQTLKVTLNIFQINLKQRKCVKKHLMPIPKIINLFQQYIEKCICKNLYNKK